MGKSGQTAQAGRGWLEEPGAGKVQEVEEAGAAQPGWRSWLWPESLSPHKQRGRVGFAGCLSTPGRKSSGRNGKTKVRENSEVGQLSFKSAMQSLEE